MSDHTHNFRDYIEKYKSLVYNVAIQYVKDVDDAADMSQEVFIELYRSVHTFRGDSEMKTWLYRITVNKCIDHLRKIERKRKWGFMGSIFGGEGELKHDKSHFDHPGILAEKREQARLLYSAIDSLPYNQRTAFILFHVEELSQKEVGAIMELSPKAVESLIQRAKASLRKILEKKIDRSEGKQNS